MYDKRQQELSAKSQQLRTVPFPQRTALRGQQEAPPKITGPPGCGRRSLGPSVLQSEQSGAAGGAARRRRSRACAVLRPAASRSAAAAARGPRSPGAVEARGPRTPRRRGLALRLRAAPFRPRADARSDPAVPGPRVAASPPSLPPRPPSLPPGPDRCDRRRAAGRAGCCRARWAAGNAPARSAASGRGRSSGAALSPASAAWWERPARQGSASREAGPTERRERRGAGGGEAEARGPPPGRAGLAHAGLPAGRPALSAAARG